MEPGENEEGEESEWEKIIEFDHDEGLVTISYCAEYSKLHLLLDGEIYSSLDIDPAFDQNVIAEVVTFEAEFWAEQGRPLEEIEYNIRTPDPLDSVLIPE